MMLRFRSLAVVIIAGCVVLLQQSAFTDETKSHQSDENRCIVPKILDQWQARRRKIETLKIVAVGTDTIGKGTLDDGNPKADLLIPVRLTWYVDLINGWFRREEITSKIGVDGNTLLPKSEILVYDGTTLRRFRPPLENQRNDSAKSISLVDHGTKIEFGDAFTIGDLPILFSIGCISWDDQGLKKTLEIPYDAGNFELLNSAYNPGVPVTLTLRANEATRNSLLEYIVDPEKDGAILAYRKLPTGSGPNFGFGGLFVTVETEYAESESMWFPAKWQASIGGSEHFLSSTSLEVEQIKFNSDLAGTLFQISDDLLQPGLLVFEGKKPFTIAADGHTRLPGFASNKNPDVANEGSSRRTGILIVNILAALAVALFLWWRKRFMKV